MCGVLGSFGEPCIKDHQRLARARVLEALLVANAARGVDATGAAMVDSLGAVNVYKRAVPSTKMVDDPKMRDLLRSKDARAVIGHTRLGTHGANTDRNAHPFREGTVTGAHNGVIYNHWTLDQKLEDEGWRKPVNVDSQVAFRVLSDVKEPGAGYSNALKLLDGSMTLTWHDQRDPFAMYLFRHQNPLAVAIVPKIDTMFWSSQADHLAPVLRAVYGSEAIWIDVKEDTLYRVSPDLRFDAMPVEMPMWGGGYYGGTGGTKTTVARPGLPFSKASKKAKRRAAHQALKDQIDAEFPARDTVPFLDEECAMCGALVMPEDGETVSNFLCCWTCAMWWDSEGADFYADDIGAAIDDMDALSTGGERVSPRNVVARLTEEQARTGEKLDEAARDDVEARVALEVFRGAI